MEEPLNAVIQTYCQRIVAGEELQEDPGLYVPATGSNTPYASQTFDLNTAIQKFLASDKKVFLLLGESGSGKSLFGQSLVQDMAKHYKVGEWISLFISLPTMRNPKQDIMQKALLQQGFSEKDISVLQKNYRFFVVLDAYDELNVIENLYKANKLDEWQVKVMISCRPSYLTQISNYRSFFIPIVKDKPQQGLLQEVYVAPFSPQQIEFYIQQYLNVKKADIEEDMQQHPEITEDWLLAKTYLSWIDQIPGLKALVQNPFLLKITMQVLPIVVAQFEQAQSQQERFNMTGAKLYDEFIKYWFERQEEKLIALGTHPGRSLQKDYLAFSQQLAKKMHEKQLTQVTYEEDSSMFEASEPSTPNEWAMFFSDNFIPSDKEDPKRRDLRILIRKGCPLRKVGVNQYAFLHTSILEYFVERYISKEMNKTTAVTSSFNQKEGLRESKESRPAAPVNKIEDIDNKPTVAKAPLQAKPQPQGTQVKLQTKAPKPLDKKDQPEALRLQPEVPTLTGKAPEVKAKPKAVARPLPKSPASMPEKKPAAPKSAKNPAGVMNKGQSKSEPMVVAKNTSPKGIMDNSGNLSISIRVEFKDLVFSNELGSGTFAVVYRGTYHGDPVAIKRLKNQTLSQGAIEELKNEVSVMKSVESPRIVRCFGACLESPNYALVMEYMPGGTLHHFLHNPEKTLTWEMCYSISIDISAGMAFLHRRHIVHGDLKSLNVLLDGNGRAKIADFGQSKIHVENETLVGSTIGGSLSWLAPELLQYLEVMANGSVTFAGNVRTTQASDTYSYGMVLWEIISRQVPFIEVIKNSSIKEFKTLVCEKGVREHINEHTPPKLKSVIQHCWFGKPEQRPKIKTALKEIEEEYRSLNFMS